MLTAKFIHRDESDEDDLEPLSFSMGFSRTTSEKERGKGNKKFSAEGRDKYNESNVEDPCSIGSDNGSVIQEAMTSTETDTRTRTFTDIVYDSHEGYSSTAGFASRTTDSVIYESTGSQVVHNFSSLAPDSFTQDENDTIEGDVDRAAEESAREGSDNRNYHENISSDLSTGQSPSDSEISASPKKFKKRNSSRLRANPAPPKKGKPQSSPTTTKTTNPTTAATMTTTTTVAITAATTTTTQPTTPPKLIRSSKPKLPSPTSAIVTTTTAVSAGLSTFSCGGSSTLEITDRKPKGRSVIPDGPSKIAERSKADNLGRKDSIYAIYGTSVIQSISDNEVNEEEERTWTLQHAEGDKEREKERLSTSPIFQDAPLTLQYHQSARKRLSEDAGEHRHLSSQLTRKLNPDKEDDSRNKRWRSDGCRKGSFSEKNIPLQRLTQAELEPTFFRLVNAVQEETFLKSGDTKVIKWASPTTAECISYKSIGPDVSYPQLRFYNEKDKKEITTSAIFDIKLIQRGPVKLSRADKAAALFVGDFNVLLSADYYQLLLRLLGSPMDISEEVMKQNRKCAKGEEKSDFMLFFQTMPLDKTRPLTGAKCVGCEVETTIANLFPNPPHLPLVAHFEVS